MTQVSITTKLLGGIAATAATIMMVAAIPAPVAANTTSPVAQWQAQVERSIDAHLTYPASAKLNSRDALTLVKLSFDDAGQFRHADLAKTSGNAAVDSEALRTANRIAYPAIPTAMVGKSVIMQIYMGNGAAADAKATALFAAGHGTVSQPVQFAALRP